MQRLLSSVYDLKLPGFLGIGIKDSSRQHLPGVSDFTQGPFPIPLEIIYHIIDHYLVPDPPALSRVSMGCRSLAMYCRPHLFRSVTVEFRRGVEKESRSEALVRLAESSRDIPSLIWGLKIQDLCRSSYFSPHYQQETVRRELEALRTILMWDLINLRKLELSVNVEYPHLPQLTKMAFEDLFQRCPIETLVLGGFTLPVDILRLLKHLKTIEIGHRGIRPSTKGDSSLSNIEVNPLITPSEFKFQDFSLTDGDFRCPEILLAAVNPQYIESLEATMDSFAVHLLQPYLPKFAGLVDLTLLLGSSTNTREPSRLSLESLTTLRAITLSADISMAGYAFQPASISLSRFIWPFETLSTLPQPSLVNNIEVRFLIGYLLRGVQYPWPLADTILFSNKENWPRLEEMRTVWTMEGAIIPNAKMRAQGEVLQKTIMCMMPSLASLGRKFMVQTLPKEGYDFWTDIHMQRPYY